MQAKNPKQIIQSLHQKYIRDVAFDEIEHVPENFVFFNSPLAVQENCLLIPYSTFQPLYPQCAQIITDPDALQHIKVQAAELSLCMNGENEKAWAVKRRQISDWFKAAPPPGVPPLDLQRELRLNGAICMKFNKSSICYTVRLEMLQHVYRPVTEILVSEDEVICRILKRFHRNYYCRTYKLRLYKFLFSREPGNQGLFEAEYQLCRQFCQQNVHDYSGYWYLYSMISSKLQKNRLEQQLRWAKELKENYEILYSESQEGRKLASLSKYIEWVDRKLHCIEKGQ